MITWGDVVEIIVNVFDINQIRLAELIGCSKPVITRIKYGENSPTFTTDRLFSSVFDPANSSSPASSGNRDSKYWLERLNEEIESTFKEVREDMEDCWDEKDYRKFVSVLLERARKGPPSKNSLSSPDDGDTSSETPDMDNNDNHCEKEAKISPNEAPSVQMSRLFAQAVADYNIAVYICKLPDYLIGEPIYVGEIYDFIDMIQTNILVKFVNHQEEENFKKISQFIKSLKSYAAFMSIVNPAVSEEYGMILRMHGYDNAIFDLIDSDYNEAENNLKGETSIEEGRADDLSMLTPQSKVNQLGFVRTILSAHKQICELFGEICPGKTILVF